MIGVQIRGVVESAIREDLDRAVLPVGELVKELAHRIQARVHGEGLAADGQPWSSYKAQRKPGGPGARFFWSPSGSPAPATNRIVLAKQGKYMGRGAYADMGAWRVAIGQPLPTRKRFVMTGELSQSIDVTVPRVGTWTIQYNKQTRASPFFRSKSGKAYTNQKVAQFAFRTERMSPMQPSAEEVEWFQRELIARVPTTFLKTIELGAREARSSTNARRLVGRANRLLR